MREIIARAVCGFTVIVVLMLSFWFAVVHNPPAKVGLETAPATTSAAEPASVARGRLVYDEQNCAACHSIAGRGNPRHPLDGAGVQRGDVRLGDRITGTGDTGLPETVARRKSKYRDLAEEDLRALEAYLLSLPIAK